MTPLLRTFVEAMEAERERYAIGGDVFKSAVWLRVDHYGRIGKEDLYNGTRADCKRFVDERAAQKGFAALRDAYDSHVKAGTQWTSWQSVASFLSQLAGDHDDR